MKHKPLQKACTRQMQTTKTIDDLSEIIASRSPFTASEVRKILEHYGEAFRERLLSSDDLQLADGRITFAVKIKDNAG